MAHNYAEGITFYFHSKEVFDKLLDQVKEISQEEYDTEAKDGFRDMYDYWNNKSVSEFGIKLISNQARINHRKNNQ